MSILREIVNHIIFFGGGLALLMALLQIFTRKKSYHKWILFFFFISIAYLIFQQYVKIVYFGKATVMQYHIFGFTKFVIGPSFYLYFKSLYIPNFSMTKRYWIHLVPALIILILSMIFLFLYLHGNIKVLQFDSIYNSIIVRKTWAIIGNIHVFTYIVYIFIDIRFAIISAKKARNRIFFYTMVMIFLVSSINIVALIEIFCSVYGMYHISMLFVSITVIYMFILNIKIPEFMVIFGREIKREKYHRSLIHGVNTDMLHHRLTDLMVKEKIFYDDELTLHKLADFLSITPHQVSEFLNDKLNVNFSNFINSYRIKEAQFLIKENLDCSVLTVAYKVGFNTKSVFYSAFSKYVGMTPAKYREKVLENRKK